MTMKTSQKTRFARRTDTTLVTVTRNVQQKETTQQWRLKLTQGSGKKFHLQRVPVAAIDLNAAEPRLTNSNALLRRSGPPIGHLDERATLIGFTHVFRMTGLLLVGRRGLASRSKLAKFGARIAPHFAFLTEALLPRQPLPPQKGKKCNLRVRYDLSPMCRVGHQQLVILASCRGSQWGSLIRC
jgi:hypothetical protein